VVRRSNKHRYYLRYEKIIVQNRRKIILMLQRSFLTYTRTKKLRSAPASPRTQLWQEIE